GVSWAPVGTTIVAWQWLGVPDKYAPPRGYDSYAEAEEYALPSGGRVEIEYRLRAPDGVTWSQPMRLPEAHRGDAAVGSVVVGCSYRPGYVYERLPSFADPDEAEAHAARRGIRYVAERLRWRAPDGVEFEADGAAHY